jgi:acetylornithine/succinyldiaminopimelate/putrescine aminotransferase
MRRRNITHNVAERGNQLMKGLESVKSPVIQSIRGLGLMVGIDLSSAGHVRMLQEKLKTQGVLSSLYTKNTVRLMPPTIISKKEIDILLRSLHTAFASLQ